MNLFSISSLNLALTVEQLAPWPAQRLTPSETDHNADLLQRTQRGEDAEDRPDTRYWTSYDHFMVEREARAARNAYLSLRADCRGVPEPHRAAPPAAHADAG